MGSASPKRDETAEFGASWIYLRVFRNGPDGVECPRLRSKNHARIARLSVLAASGFLLGNVLTGDEIMNEPSGDPFTRIDKYIGFKVRWLRRDRKLLPESLALKIDMDLDQYKRSEAGDRRFRSIELYKLAKVFEVGIQALMPGADALPEKLPASSQQGPSESELYELMHYFSGIRDHHERALLIKQARVLSSFRQ